MNIISRSQTEMANSYIYLLLEAKAILAKEV